jgi:hypothetical protein
LKLWGRNKTKVILKFKRGNQSEQFVDGVSHPPLACIIGAQYHITCTSQELKTADGYPFSLITLNAYSVSAFEAFRLRSEELYEAVKKRFVLEQLETLQRLQ